MADTQQQAEGAAPPPGERRGAPRFETALPVQVGSVKARLTDLSATGIGFVAPEPLEPGMQVEIGVRHLPDERHPPPSTAEVVRVQPTDGGFAIGARLAQPAKPD